MSTVKVFVNSLLVVIFISQAIVTNVAGIPAKKKPPNLAQKITPLTAPTTVLPKSTRPIKKPNTRDPRFLGKFSFVAGLNLPTPQTMSPIHRNDIIIKQQVPTRYVTTYNFPPSSWGPFAAAVYEPPPIPSFLEDPLGYLAAIFNPYNWFNSSFSTTNIPTTITTIEPDKNQDDVYLLVQDRDNEIPNEKRMNKIETKIGHQNIDKRKYITRATPFELSTVTRDYTTAPYDEESDTDLIAEESSTKPIENVRLDQNFEDNSRQFPWPWSKTTTTTTTTERTTLTERHARPTQPQTRPTQPQTRPTQPQTRPTQPQTRPTQPQTRPTVPLTRPTQPPTRPTMKTTAPANVTLPPQNHNTTSAMNDTMGVTTSPTNATNQKPYPPNNGYYYGGRPQNVSHIDLTTSSTNATSQTPYPPNNVTYPIYNHGYYYYGGRPQNVSHIELTTAKTTSIDEHIESFNDVNQYLQPYQPNYQDFDEPPNEEAMDFFRRSEQLPPLPNNYYDKNRKFTFNNMDDNGLHGFKPSFPLHF